MVGTVVLKTQDNGSSYGFSRGTSGYVAIGDLNGVTFDTGLPDGDYCDIISDCAQTITISGGSGVFTHFDANEPVVAICVNDCN